MLTRPVRDEFVIADDITLHSVQWGEKGTPIIGIHGLTANAFFFQALADELAGDHRLMAYDLRGRGDSDKPEEDYSIPIHGADLSAFIDELRLERPVIVGHSLGALIGLYFAAHYPDKISKLVLIDAGASLAWKTFDDQPAWLKSSISRLGTAVPSFKEYIARLKAIPFLGSYWNAYMDIFYQHDVIVENDDSVISKTYRAALVEEANRTSEARPEDQWPHIQVPTLLLRAGEGLFSNDDQLLTRDNVKAIEQGIRNCRSVEFPTLNHYTINLGVERGPALEIRKFIDEE